MPNKTYTYSFGDVNCTMTGPGGVATLGNGSGAAEGGVSFEPVEDIDAMTIGADGTPMHSLILNKGGKIAVNLLKTSPINAILSQMMAIQRASAANHGQNLLSLANPTSGDVITCQQVAFARPPRAVYDTKGEMMSWEFNAGVMDMAFGSGIN